MKPGVCGQCGLKGHNSEEYKNEFLISLIKKIKFLSIILVYSNVQYLKRYMKLLRSYF